MGVRGPYIGPRSARTCAVSPCKRPAVQPSRSADGGRGRIPHPACREHRCSAGGDLAGARKIKGIGIMDLSIEGTKSLSRNEEMSISNRSLLSAPQTPAGLILVVALFPISPSLAQQLVCKEIHSSPRPLICPALLCLTVPCSSVVVSPVSLPHHAIGPIYSAFFYPRLPFSSRPPLLFVGESLCLSFVDHSPCTASRFSASFVCPHFEQDHQEEGKEGGL